MRAALVALALTCAAVARAHAQPPADSARTSLDTAPIGVPPISAPALSPAAAAAPSQPSRARRVDVGFGIPLGVPPDTLSARLRAAVEKAGLDPSRAGFTMETLDLWRGGEGRLPLFETLMADPIRSPDLIRILGAGALRATTSAADLALFAGERAAIGVRRGLIASPHAGRWDATADVKSLERVLAALRDDGTGGSAAAKSSKAKSSKSKSKTSDEGGVRTRGDVPADARHLAAFLLDASRGALEWRDEALAGAANGGDLDSAFALLLRVYAATDTAESPGAARDARRAEAFLDGVDLRLLHAGAMDLALALDEARSKLAALDLAGEYYLEAETPLGTVIVDGAASTTYTDRGPYLLIIDSGGHDTYAGGAATLAASTPVSIILEIDGDDQYFAADSTRPSWGGACLGYAMLVDVAGNDTYQGAFVSQGAGLAGAGVLLDLAGNDRYGALVFAQGAAVHGIGALGDRAGRDRYVAFQAAQGFGGARGAGVLADSSGNDEYRADDQTIRFPSAQSAAHNTSLAQGFGCGKRSDFSDGHSRAGGVGILADADGNDTYRAGVFAQGSAYWYSTGILFDGGGNDSFDGVWYAQGAAAHFAFGALADMEGNDTYRATQNMAQGAGHDFSVGLLADYSGDDHYESPNLSLGGGNSNGLGIFFEAAGHESYTTDGATVFGRGNTSVPRGGLRDLFPTIGVFLDIGGRDDYPRGHATAGNAKAWRQEGVEHPALTTEEGYGYDSQ
ncbi:MAG: hypothetical protein ACKVU1_18095 [bacterium]